MLPEVVRDIDADDARWKPPSGAWSILEIVSHLADEEEYDFRVRINATLVHPDQDWPPIDPEGWAVERHYNAGDLGTAVDRFVSLRRRSVAWLHDLHNPNWSQEHDHPQFGLFPAADLFAAWAAHDYLHLRQISKRMYEIVQRDAEDSSTQYAGEW
jgi:hypothetical protein